MSLVSYTIVSRTPMLLNPMKDIDGLTGPAKPKVTMSPMEEAELKVLTDSKGVIGLPDTYLYGCLVNAGREVAFRGKQKVSTAESTRLYSFFELTDSFFPLTNGDPTKPASWVPDIQSANVSQGKKNMRVRVVRPRFDQWSLTFTARIDDEVAALEMVEEVIKKAGFVGLGSFTPRCKGRYGQFRLANVAVIEPPTTKQKPVVDVEEDDEDETPA